MGSRADSAVGAVLDTKNKVKDKVSRVENACKPLILLGLQKNIKIISTHLLTVLIISAILQLEQGERKRKDS